MASGARLHRRAEGPHELFQKRRQAEGPEAMAKKLVREQPFKAGVRLAEILNNSVSRDVSPCWVPLQNNAHHSDAPSRSVPHVLTRRLRFRGPATSAVCAASGRVAQQVLRVSRYLTSACSSAGSGRHGGRHEVRSKHHEVEKG